MNHSIMYHMTTLFLLKVRSMLLFSTLLFAVFLPQLSYAEFAVIVHPSNNIQLSPKDIQRIFLGQSKSFSNNLPVIPVDQPIGMDIRKKFSEKLLKKSNQQIKAYWARQIFTGKGLPPKELTPARLVKEFVAQNKNAIGYIDADLLDTSVKKALVF